MICFLTSFNENNHIMFNSLTVVTSHVLVGASRYVYLFTDAELLNC
jgi:hypothetical protein